MDPYKKVATEAPTELVRIWPYLFRYESRVINMVAGSQPVRLTPQGNPAAGNRVTWGWKIRIIVEDSTAPNIFSFQGEPIILPIGVGVYDLVDTTLNNGTDVTYYEIFGVTGNFTIHAIEQILQISEL
jgi:hypothetical protein